MNGERLKNIYNYKDAKTKSRVQLAKWIIENDYLKEIVKNNCNMKTMRESGKKILMTILCD